jgi:hypothetical protein
MQFIVLPWSIVKNVYIWSCIIDIPVNQQFKSICMAYPILTMAVLQLIWAPVD